MIKNSNKNKNVFDVMELLSKSFMNEKEVSKLLGIKPSTFYKYMNLLKKAGFVIKKVEEKYKIISFSNSVEFCQMETSVIAYIMFLSYILFPKLKTISFHKLIDKLLQVANKKNYLDVMEKFEKLKITGGYSSCGSKTDIFEKNRRIENKLEIYLKEGDRLILLPNNMVFKNQKIFLEFKDEENKIKKLIDINDIKKLTPQRKETKFSIKNSETIFEIRGRLAKIYRQKENERIVENFEDRIIVANNSPDKKALYKRLLKYDTLCKIKFPKKDSDEFKKIIEKSLENLAIIKDNYA